MIKDSHDADDDAYDDEIYLVAIAGSRRHYHQLVANEEFPEFVLESSGTGRRSEIAWTRLGGAAWWTIFYVEYITKIC